MSDLMKISRLVNGDDFFKMRVEAACWSQNVDFTESVLKHVAADETVLSAASMDEYGTIDSSEVPDSAILAAVGSLAE